VRCAVGLARRKSQMVQKTTGNGLWNSQKDLGRKKVQSIDTAEMRDRSASMTLACPKCSV